MTILLRPPTLLLISILILTTHSNFYSCPAGYFFDIQHCQLCLPNCACSSMNTCDKCIDGYTMYLNTCIQCPQASGIYGTCSNCCSKTTGTQLSCTDCAVVANTYTFLYSGRCIVSPGCYQIDKQGFCTQCFPGFYQRNNLCYTCHASCSTCTDSSNCLKCASGYYWGVVNGGLCTACPIGCSSCDSNGKCQSCLVNYFLFTDHCLNCPANCNYCTDGSTCTSCSAGLLVSNLCITCTDTTYGGSVGCKTCSAVNNFIVCSQCQDTYFLDQNGVCQTCASFITGGLRCRDKNTPTQCQSDYDTILSNRYYLVGITCIKNIKNCRKISNIQANCSQCYDGYTLTGGTCTQCAFTGCLATNRTVVSNVCTCTVCDIGFYLNGVSCSACSTLNCAVCASDVCTSCKTGFFLNAGTCTSNLMLNCLTQASAVICATCNSGFYRGTNNLCHACQANCMACTARFTCTKCMSTHYLHSSGTCVVKPNNCVQITSNACSLCAYGYYLKNGLCLACQIELGTVILYIFS